jgi:hypothetical protein
LDARNHEVTLLKIKHIRFREKYGEGEIPHEAKTGSGPILLTCSFPYVRDWLNEHPFKNELNARLICNLQNGAPVKSDVLWKVMKKIRTKIIRLLNDGCITDPYCIRHSAITSDSDYLPEYALKKKVRWSMNSRQGSRYIKRRMGDELKKQILVRNGIISEDEIPKKPSVLPCGRCGLINSLENKYCSTCSYPLTPHAFEEIKEDEDKKIHALEQKHELEMKGLREEMYQNFGQIISLINQNPQLANIKPEVMSKKVLIEEQK